MFKLVFLLVVLVAVTTVVIANPHPRQAKSKKVSPHHGLDSHGHGRAPVKRVARSHGAHTPVHHAPGGSAGVYHSNKVSGARGLHSLRASNHAVHKGKKAAPAHPIKHKGHRK